MKKTVCSVLIIYFAARLALLGAAYYLTPDAAFYGDAAAAINSFSAEYQARSIEYYKWGFEFRALSLISATVYAFICVSLLFKRYGQNFFSTNIDASIEGYFTLARDAAGFYIGSALAVFPYRFVLGYMREKRFGFFNQGPGGWLTLHIKQLAVGLCIILTALLIARAVVSLFEKKWHYALSFCFPAVCLAGSIILQSLVIPIFYETTTLGDAGLKERLISVAKSAGINAREISVINESRYSGHTNAFFTGFGPFRRIYLCDTLFDGHDSDEITAIYAHELGHYVYDHELVAIALAAAAAAAFFFAAAALTRQMGGGAPAVYFFNRAALLGLIMANAGYFFIMPVENFVSRHFERAADSFALNAAAKYFFESRPEAGRKNSLALAAHAQKRLMIKLCEKNLSVAAPERFNYFFFSTHPAPIERVAAAESFAAAELRLRRPEAEVKAGGKNGGNHK